MTDQEKPAHWPAFQSKMEKEGLSARVIDTFSFYYEKVVSGETGLIRDADITPLDPQQVADAERLDGYAAAGRRAYARAVMIKLNGGLGTSMGLTGAKSLLTIKAGRTFLDIIVNQASRCGVQLALMNSFSTHAETGDTLARLKPAEKPAMFLQHRFPKILQQDLSPASWPPNPELEWNPPGHGDIYLALHTSGTLKMLLDKGIRYAFISNSDNLGATMEPALLGYFVEHRFPFMMEAAPRTPSDVKGGHLARWKEEGLVLRESAQCPEEELDAFRDIRRYRFFNTNSIWLDLSYLKELLQQSGFLRLPMILNPKTLDPRDEKSPPVFQVETAMGAAISLFSGAAVVKVPRSRFFPVKKSNDLLAVRSDAFILSEDDRLALNPRRASAAIQIDLDPRYYKKIDQFEARFPEGVPSLVDCESLTIRGDVRFEKDVVIKGRVTIDNSAGSQAVIRKGTVIDSDLAL